MELDVITTNKDGIVHWLDRMQEEIERWKELVQSDEETLFQALHAPTSIARNTSSTARASPASNPATTCRRMPESRGALHGPLGPPAARDDEVLRGQGQGGGRYVVPAGQDHHRPTGCAARLRYCPISPSHTGPQSSAHSPPANRSSELLQGQTASARSRRLRALGVAISIDDHGVLRVEGRAAALTEPNDVLDCGTGTTMRLLSGVLAARPFRSVLTGDDSLRSRPMRRIADPLARWVRTSKPPPPVRPR